MEQYTHNAYTAIRGAAPGNLSVLGSLLSIKLYFALPPDAVVHVDEWVSEWVSVGQAHVQREKDVYGVEYGYRL